MSELAALVRELAALEASRQNKKVRMPGTGLH